MALSTEFSLPGPSFDRLKYARKSIKSAVPASVVTNQPISEGTETEINDLSTGVKIEVAMAQSNWPAEQAAPASPAGCSNNSTETTSGDEDTHDLTDLTSTSADEEMPQLVPVSRPGSSAATVDDMEPTPGNVHHILTLLPSVMTAYGHRMAELNAQELQSVHEKIDKIIDQVPRVSEQVERLTQQVKAMGEDMKAMLSTRSINVVQHASTESSRQQDVEASYEENKPHVEIKVDQQVEQQPAEEVHQQAQGEIMQQETNYGPATLMTSKYFSLSAIPAPSGENANESPNARRLVSIRRIHNIRQVRVENRLLAVAQIDAWTCIVPRQAFRDGELIVFCMIDSFLPASDIRFGRTTSCQTYQGLSGYRVKTERFGSYPNKLEIQGKIFPLARFPEINNEITYIRRALNDGPDEKLSSADTNELILAMYRKKDWATELKVVKWVEPAPVSNPAEFPRLGATPTRVFHRTDVSHLEDCPNLFKKPKYNVHEYQESVKMDGSSMTVYFVKKNTNKYRDLNELPVKIGPNTVLETGRFGVCSKNVDLHELNMCDFWKVALRNDLPAKLAKLDRSIAIQGEICGPNINQNRENLTEAQFFVYSMWDIATQKYIDPRKVEDLARKLGLSHVPVRKYIKIQKYVKSHQQLRDIANEQPGEGLVYKCVNDGRSFKVHSTKYKILHNC